MHDSQDSPWKEAKGMKECGNPAQSENFILRLSDKIPRKSLIGRKRIYCFMWIIFLVIQKTKHSQAKSGTWVDEGRCNYPQSSSSKVDATNLVPRLVL